MVGSPRNAEKALDAGCNVLIAQGYEVSLRIHGLIVNLRLED